VKQTTNSTTVDAIDVEESDDTEAGVSSASAREPQISLFRTVWRWHFYAGIITAPFLMTLAITGIIYIFSPEIGRLLRSDLAFVEPQSQRLTPSELIHAAQTHADGWEVTGLVAPPELDRSVTVSVVNEDAGTKKELYLNPYDATVLGELDPQADPVRGFFKVVLDIHRHLFIGTTGRVIIELVTSWGLVLLCTGIFLWWPRRREKVRGVWIPRLKAKPYVILRDVHALAGIYLLPVLLLIVSTGLFYTVVWGKGVFVVSTVANSGIAGLSEFAEGKGKTEKDEQEKVLPASEQINAAWFVAANEYPDRSLELVMKNSSESGINIRAMNAHSTGTYGSYKYDNVIIDPQSKTMTSVERLSDHPGYWLHGWTYPLHVGSFWGPTTKVIWLVACLVLAGMPVTGLWMWWKRRPQGQSGFPRRREHGLPWWLTALIVLCCLFFPLAGVSVLLVLLIDFLRNRGFKKKSGSV
tara:strand:- start:60360 stop:61763 length:1404 start_codon:yes stop_codon:yes gene_type:complete